MSVEITLVADPLMKKLNFKHMGKSGTTDVLSFPQIQAKKGQIGKPKIFLGQFLGDVVVSLDQASRQAKQQGIALKNEVLFLIFHSLLHLIGYDHATKSECAEMQKRESFLWKKIVLGLSE